MKFEKSGIYKITNISDNKLYIGSAINLKKRESNHFYDLENNKHHNVHLQRAYNLYGNNNFIFGILEYCPKEFLLIKEQYYIDTLKPEYNIRKFAENNLGLKYSEESKRKMSESAKGNKYCLGYKHSEEIKLRISLSHKGRKLTEDHKRKIGLGNKGIKRSKETKIKMSLAKKMMSDETRGKMSLSKKGNKNNLGKNLSEKTKQKISESNKGKKQSEGARKKMSESHKGLKHSDEAKRKISASMKILMINKKINHNFEGQYHESNIREGNE
jgi:group I intron endonuclease